MGQLGRVKGGGKWGRVKVGNKGERLKVVKLEWVKDGERWKG